MNLLGFLKTVTHSFFKKRVCATYSATLQNDITPQGYVQFPMFYTEALLFLSWLHTCTQILLKNMAFSMEHTDIQQ